MNYNVGTKEAYSEASSIQTVKKGFITREQLKQSTLSKKYICKDKNIASISKSQRRQTEHSSSVE